MEKINISVPGKPEYLTTLRLIAGSIANNAGFDIEVLEDIKLAVSEGFKTVYCHNRDCWSNKIDVEFLLLEDSIEITISDSCEGENIEKIGNSCINCPSEGEVGKIVIESLVEEVEFGIDSMGCKFVRMVKINDKKDKQRTI